MTERERLAAALPGYEIGAELGRGAFGVVLSGTQRALGREVAIKVLPAALAGDEGQRRRFNAEARLVAALDHPHVVRVFDYVEQDDLFLLVMEKLVGGTLDDRVGSAALAAPEACAVLLATAGALHYAHQRGILHRDVKPANVLFTGDGTVKLGDFGIAKVLEHTSALTATGSIMGTPAYMAPEQATGGELGPATDVYAAGVVLYLLLAGRLPFATEGEPLAQLYRKVNEDPEPLSQVAPTVPRPLATVTHRALATDPERRYPSAEAFAVALAESATTAFGPGWLPATRVPVLTSGALSAALERVVEDPEATVTLPRPSAGPTAAATTAPSRRRRRVLVAVALALAVTAAAVAGALALGGGDDDDPTASATTPTTTTPSDPPEPTEASITAASLSRFDRQCRASGVDPDTCACVADAATTDGLTEQDFAEAVDRLGDDGALVNGLDQLFADCRPS